MIVNDEVKLIESIFFQCQNGFVGVSLVVGEIESQMKVASPSEIQNVTLKIIEQLLRSYPIKVGFPTKDGKNFISWNLESDEVISQIKFRWQTLGKELNIGEIAYLTAF